MAHTLDPFDDVLNLEDQFYAEGYRQGIKDGGEAGKVEGRSFGLEKGFEKFAESGRLYGKAVVWANRLPSKQQPSSIGAGGSTEPGSSSQPRLPPFTSTSRLEKNIIALHALVEPDTLSTENSEESVNDFDDRINRARGKTRMIEKAINDHAPADSTADGNTETVVVDPSTQKPPGAFAGW